MPVYQMRAPDGNTYEIEGPEGANDAQVKAEILRQNPHLGAPAPAPALAKPAKPAGPKRPSTLDVAISAPYKALAAIPDAIYGAPQNIYNLGKAAFGTAATAFGRPDLAPEVQEPSTPVTNFLRQQGLIRDTNNMSAGQQVLDTTLQALTGGALSPAQSVRQASVNALWAGMGGFAGETTSQVTGSPLAGMAVGVALPSAITARQQKIVAARDTANAQNAVRDATFRAAQAEGYAVPPGNVKPNMVNRALEQAAGKTELQQIAAAKNQKVTDKLARRAVGIGETDELTPDTMKAVRAEAAAKGYAPVAKVGQVPVDNDYLTAMQDIEDRFTGAAKSFPDAVPGSVRKIIDDNLVNNFDAQDAMKRIQSLRDNASAAFRKGEPDIAKANRAVAKALEDQIERHLAGTGQQGAKMLADFRAARERMAISYTLEDAMREGTGSIDAKKLAAELNRSKGKLTGDLRTAAQFASTFPNVNSAVPGSIGTPGVINRFGALTVTGLLGTLVAGLPGGALGAVAPAAARSLSQRYLLSNRAQRNALASAPGPTRRAFAEAPEMDPYLYNALIARPIAEQ